MRWARNEKQSLNRKATSKSTWAAEVSTISAYSIAAHQSKAYSIDRAYFTHADVTDWDSLQAAFKFSIKHSPANSLDIVFPSAGVMGSPTLSCSFPPDLNPDADLPEPASGKVIDINFKAVYNTTVLALHYFAKNASATTNGHVSCQTYIRLEWSEVH